jgi:hypothetical protein
MIAVFIIFLYTIIVFDYYVRNSKDSRERPAGMRPSSLLLSETRDGRHDCR